MSIHRPIRSTPLALACLIAALGCHHSEGPIVPVSGRVTYNGVNLQGGYIVFVPDASRGESGAIAYGKILLDGSYTLTTGEAHGAAAGWYRVAVSAVHPGVQQGQSPAFPQWLIPEKYSNPELSQLVCEVTPNHANSIDFHLK